MRAGLLHSRYQGVEQRPVALPLAGRQLRDVARQGRWIREARAPRQPFPNACGANAGSDDTHRDFETLHYRVAKRRNEAAAAAAGAWLRIIRELPLAVMKRCD